MLHTFIKSVKLLIRYLGTWLDPNFARLRFHNAKCKSEWLDYNCITTLQNSNTLPDWNQYDDTNIKLRGAKRAGLIKNILGKKINTIKEILDVGCWDGMVAAQLCSSGKKVTAIDINDCGFHNTAVAAGVNFNKMDASHLYFENDSFDFIYSFDAFEHFQNPEKVLSEMSRVLRKNGFLYLSFGPLYMSPFGLHAESITFPYCQLMFSKEDLQKYITQKNLRPIDFQQVNGWTLQKYRSLFCNHAELKPHFYREVHDPRHLNIIAEFPSIFKYKSTRFDEFTVGAIEVLFQKK